MDADRTNEGFSPALVHARARVDRDGDGSAGRISLVLPPDYRRFH